MRPVVIALLLLGMGSGCSAELRPDPFPSAIDHSYPSAEIHVGDKIQNGIAVVIADGNPLPSVRVQGYYDGDVLMTSDECGINVGRHYSGNEKISIPIPSKPNKQCVVAITVTPQYPKPGDQAIEIKGFSGYVAVTPKTDTDFVTATFKVPSGPDWQRYVPIFYGDPSPIRGVFQGCGVSTDRSYTPDGDGWLRIPMHDLVDQSKVCLLSGLLIHPFFANVGIRVLISQYDPKFVPLSIPSEEIDDDDLILTGNPEVTISAWDHNDETAIEVDHIITIPDFKKRRGLHVRMLTIKGRSVFGTLGPGGFVWIQ